MVEPIKCLGEVHIDDIDLSTLIHNFRPGIVLCKVSLLLLIVERQSHVGYCLYSGEPEDKVWNAGRFQIPCQNYL